MLQDLRTLNSADHALTHEDQVKIRERVFQYGSFFYRAAASHDDYKATKSDIVFSVVFCEFVINDAFMYQLSSSGIAKVSIDGIKGFINRHILVHSESAQRAVGSLISIVTHAKPDYIKAVLEAILQSIKDFCEIKMPALLASQCFKCSRSYLSEMFYNGVYMGEVSSGCGK